MSLFVGGPWDGRRLDVPDDTDLPLLAEIGGTCLEYDRCDISHPMADTPVEVFVLDGLTHDEVMKLLIEHYRPPGKEPPCNPDPTSNSSLETPTKLTDNP